MCPLCGVILMPVSSVWVEHLLKNHKKKMIDDVLNVYPVYLGRCVIEPCNAMLGSIEDVKEHLSHHTRGLVTAWVEARKIGSFVKRTPDVRKYPSRSSLDEFFLEIRYDFGKSRSVQNNE